MRWTHKLCELHTDTLYGPKLNSVNKKVAKYFGCIKSSALTKMLQF